MTTYYDFVTTNTDMKYIHCLMIFYLILVVYFVTIWRTFCGIDITKTQQFDVNNFLWL